MHTVPYKCFLSKKVPKKWMQRGYVLLSKNVLLSATTRCHVMTVQSCVENKRTQWIYECIMKAWLMAAGGKIHSSINIEFNRESEIEREIKSKMMKTTFYGKNLRTNRWKFKCIFCILILFEKTTFYIYIE